MSIPCIRPVERHCVYWPDLRRQHASLIAARRMCLSSTADSLHLYIVDFKRLERNFEYRYCLQGLEADGCQIASHLLTSASACVYTEG